MSNTDDESVAVRIGPLVGIRGVSLAHSALLEEARRSDKIVVDFAPESDVDVSTIQMLAAARLYADRNGKSLHLTKAAKQACAPVLGRGGFLQEASPETSDFWLDRE